ncbi:DUF1549 domain-containing protein [Stieleria varia]|uniref:DUF1549 domain-containing protein n=1 Tax=Stieleria varia TaxID=2528005 RepID=A0A5C6B4T8_9BACT|nr:DUF1549 domain-containing protein [Stieleria varia]TWU06296.1 hypothetical protein Pla52n_20170 [Stieleria varia]
MRLAHCWILSVGVACLSVVCLRPQTSLGSDVYELAKRIDRHIDARLRSEEITPTDFVDHAAFLRRVTLDLAGRIPTQSELDDYLNAEPRDRKQRLVKRLIESPDFAYHQRNQLDILLLLRQEHNDKWREYLLEATRDNRPWDRLFREIMLPEESPSSDPRPVAFLKRRTNDLDAMTNDSSVTWFGVNVACAKCHDHPLVSDWTQAHYYGMAAFFQRTFQTRKGFIGERFDGRPKFTDENGEQQEAEFMFLTGTKVADPPLEFSEEELKQLNEQIKQAERDDKAEVPPRPDFRPRARLVELALSDDQQQFFARNITNRIWARFFGRGIVHPLDQMHSENPPSHPELLSELSDDLRESGYDLRRLIHAIVLSEPYARSVERASDAAPMPPELFAAAVPRPLSPRQLALSLRMVSIGPEKMLQWQSNEWEKQREQLERQADGLARSLVIPDDDEFQVPVSEALWFSNNQTIENDILNGSGDRLVGYLKTLESDSQLVSVAVKVILSREADDEETQAMATYLRSRTDRREQAIKQILWSLLGSPEFRFNH